HFVAHAPDANDNNVTERFPLLADRPMLDGNPTAYLCREGACKLPATSVEELDHRLAEMDVELGSGADAM
ncbi:MAG: hypothetical protein M3412_01540, partial [Chloroflexota bacterium]|nr:hypothetical protein [Chloroflexota bacterium]